MLNFSQQIMHAIYTQNQKHLSDLKNKQNKKFHSTLCQLKTQQDIFKDKNSNYKLTNKGLIKMQRIRWQAKKNKKSNKKTLIIFDIPETERRTRDLFRRCLYELGFSRIQKSVFISEHDVFNDLQELIKNCDIDEYVEIFTLQ